jgi:acetylglutamate kinase
LRITLKLGGSILEDSGIRGALLQQVAELHRNGIQVILVHGGGKNLSRCLEQIGLTSHFVDGLRVTDPETMRVALMVLAGEVNKSLVLELAACGVIPFGMCGADALAVRCTPAEDLPGYPEGLGFVGKPTVIERRVFDLLLAARLVPVIASIAVGDNFQAYNVNADQMASACAWGTASEALVYLTDVPGVMAAGGTVIPRMGRDEIQKLRADGTIAGGMMPKTASCLEALAHGIGSVYILPGASPDILRKFRDGTLKEGTIIHGTA